MNKPALTNESFPDDFLGPALCPVCEDGYLVGYRDINTSMKPSVPCWYLQCVNGCGSEIADAHCVHKNKLSALENNQS